MQIKIWSSFLDYKNKDISRLLHEVDLEVVFIGDTISIMPSMGYLRTFCTEYVFFCVWENNLETFLQSVLGSPNLFHKK